MLKYNIENTLNNAHLNRTKLGKLLPHYISDLTQADRSFFVSLSLRSSSKHGIRIRPKFSLTQDYESKNLLREVKAFLGHGTINDNMNTFSSELTVDSLIHLKSKIIPHFKEYPLYGAKKNSFDIFEYVVNKLINKEHYDKNVLS